MVGVARTPAAHAAEHALRGHLDLTLRPLILPETSWSMSRPAATRKNFVYIIAALRPQVIRCFGNGSNSLARRLSQTFGIPGGPTPVGRRRAAAP